METNSQEELRDWMEKQMAYLDPPATFRPDASAALSHLRTRRRHGRRKFGWAVAAAAMVGFVLLLPPGRVIAQQVWQYLTIHKAAFIHVQRWPAGAPAPQIRLGGIPIPPIPARDVEEMRRRVRYDPRLPGPGVLSTAPRLSTTFSLSAGIVVRTGDLEIALHKAGVNEQVVPAQWDGANVALHTSSIAIAEWPEVALVQSLPLTLSAPPNFDFAAFSALLLRVFGVAPQEALQLAQRMDTAPAWLIPLTPDFENHTALENIVLNSGPALLLQETGDTAGARRTTIVWSVPDRVYLLDGKISRELAIAVANSVQ